MPERKILFVTNNGIEDAAFGGAKASRRNYELLKEYGQVDVAAILKKSNLASMLSIAGGYFPPSGKGDLTRIGTMLDNGKYDFAFFDGSHFGNLIEYVKERGVKVICFFHNCEYDYIEVRFGKRKSLKKSIYKNLIQKQEKMAAQAADLNIVFTKRDAERICGLYQVKKPEILPLSLIDVYERREPGKEERECLLFGPLGQANQEAFGWFVKEVAPYLHCKTRVAGKGFEAYEKVWGSKKVIVQGFVQDIAQLYADAACVAIPLLSGGGMKIKTAEALMFGKYIFGTDEAFVGYEGAFEKIGGKCNSAQAFIDKLNTFLQKEKDSFSVYSRQLYEEKYSMEASREAFAKLLKRLYSSE